MWLAPNTTNTLNVSSPGNSSQNLPVMPIFTSGQFSLLEDLTSSFGWLSLVCTLFLIATYGTFKMKRKYPANFTFYFCISAFVTDAAFVIGSLVGYDHLLTENFKPTNTCIAQGIALQFFGSATAVWWFLLTINLFFVLRQKYSLKKYNRYFHAVAWTWSFVVTAVPLFCNKFGPAGLWCWITATEKSVWQFSLLYGWMGVMVVIGTLLWVAIILTMIKTRTNHTTVQNFAKYARYVLFVVCMLLVYSIVVVHRIIYAVAPFKDSFALWILHSWALSSIGFFVFLVFGTATDMYTGWWIKIRNLYQRCTSNKFRPLPDGTSSSDSLVYRETGPVARFKLQIDSNYGSDEEENEKEEVEEGQNDDYERGPDDRYTIN